MTSSTLPPTTSSTSFLRTVLALASLALAACSSTTAVRAGDLDPADMDLSADPGVDFYRYSNGGWLDRTEIPAEQSSWGLSSEVLERNQSSLRTILEEASGADGSRDELARKLGDFWSCGMDVDAIAAAGVAPLEGKLALIDSIQDSASFAVAVAGLHAIGVNAIFGFGSGEDLQDPTSVIAWSMQGGLGLPDRDYYTRDDDQSVELRAKYTQHVARMLALIGVTDSEEAARTILAIETRLAEHSLTKLELRNPQNLDRSITIDEARSDMSNFDWDAFLAAAGVPELASLNQPMPEFFRELNLMLTDVSLDDWKTYLRWHLATKLAAALSDDLVSEDFGFFQTTLSGTPEMQPRWKRVLGATNAALGEALGRLYVESTFSPEAKRRAREMVEQLIVVMNDRIARNEWMSDETKEQAALKLAGLGMKIGYPDEWRDWSGLEIRRDSYAANVMRAAEHEYARDIAKIGTSVDPNEWGMNPQTLNAYYHPIRNEIVFPAAILQPPFFSEESDDPLNYGAIGAVIGHEITHGFDDSGSQFDAEGKLRNWWTDSDRAEFESRTARLVEQYNAYEPIEGVFVNGELTLGENIADLSGLSISFEAMTRANEGIADDRLGDFSRSQRFFLAFGRVWRRKMRDEAVKLMVNTNPHSPAMFRAVGPLRNMQEFADAFGVEEGPMSLPAEERAVIW